MDLPPVIPGGITSNSVRLRLSAHPALAQLQLRPIMGSQSGLLKPSARWVFENCWLVDITQLTSNTVYSVDVIGKQEAALIRTPPSSLDGSQELLIGLHSCYFQSRADWLKPQNVVACLKERAQLNNDPLQGIPHASILCGDQIYGDVPAGGFQDVAAIYPQEYARTWSNDRLGAVLRMGANFFTCDDHEYWNDYPARQSHLTRSWDRNWHNAAKVAMKELWKQQAMWNFAPGLIGGEAHHRGWCFGELGAHIPIFLSDTRTDRTDRQGVRRPDVLSEIDDGEAHIKSDTTGFMSPAQEGDLAEWLGNLEDGAEKVGILVLGQPLLLEESSVDSALRSYSQQFSALMEKIKAAVTNGVTLIVLSGDIHWGRLVSWKPRGVLGAGTLFEFVASPIGLVGVTNFLGSWMPGPSRKSQTQLSNPQNWDKWPLQGQIKRHFATNQNNFGLISVRKDDRQKLILRFELWNLETKEIALSQWDIPGDLYDGKCIYES